MDDQESIRQKVLAAIRLALQDTVEQAVPLPVVENSRIFKKQAEELVDGFARVFGGIDGEVVRCEDDLQLAIALKALLQRRGWTRVSARSPWLEQQRGEVAFEGMLTTLADEDPMHVEVGITDCEYLVASTGSIVMSSAQTAGRAFPVYVPIHIVIARESQLVYDLDEAIRRMEQRYQGDYPSAWYLMSGPSRTGDIEKTLVLGVHGPVEVFVFLIK